WRLTPAYRFEENGFLGAIARTRSGRDDDRDGACCDHGNVKFAQWPNDIWRSQVLVHGKGVRVSRYWTAPGVVAVDYGHLADRCLGWRVTAHVLSPAECGDRGRVAVSV